MKRSYHNRWMPQIAQDVLASEGGSILDVGGGAAPYFRASHILDLQPYRPAQLRANAWGGEQRTEDGGKAMPSPGPADRPLPEEEVEGRKWTTAQYTQLDLCGGERWPFRDDEFDLGFSSHSLEDLRDPLPAVRELSRVAKRVLIVTPSRLLEQTKGIDHPRYCGFYHHPWIVFEENGGLVFRRKTPVVMLQGCHVRCPQGKTLRVNDGTMVFCGDRVDAEERMFWTEKEDAGDYRRFLEPLLNRRDLFVPDDRRSSLRSRIWSFKQKWLGEV